MANLVFIFKVLTMIFFSSGKKKAVSARTLGWVLSRGSARWCEALGALTPAPSPAPPPGAPARPPSPPPASPKEEEKRPLGEGREAGAASRRFRAENSSKGRAALSAVPAPPHTPWKFSGNYFQPPPALSCTSRRTKPFLLGVRGLASWEEGRVSASLGPRPGARPARNHRNGGSHHRPRSRLGLLG